MSSPKLRVIFWPKSEIQTFFRPKSGGLQKKKKKKKKKVFTKIETDFSAGFVTFRSVGGDASRNGAELFKIRADFSAKIVTFRLVGGCIPPPKSATGLDNYSICQSVLVQISKYFIYSNVISEFQLSTVRFAVFES